MTELQGDYLTIDEAGEVMKRKATLVRTLCREGRFRGAKKMGISGLSGDGIQKLAEHAKWLLEEQEIAALKAKYGTTPNAETIAAMEAADAGIGELVTLEQIQAECDALR
jgi:hypothetical protein